MNAFQHIIALCLRESSSKKTSFSRLARFGISVCAETNRRRVKQFSGNFDRKVLQWKASVVDGLHKSESRLPTYQFVGDNLDLYRHVRDVQSKNESLHWFHLAAVEERVIPPTPLYPLIRKEGILSIALTDFLPSYDDLSSLRDEFIILVARLLTTHVPELAVLRSRVPFHIEHEFSSVASNASSYVPLGLFDLNENTKGDMEKIVEVVDSYVPYLENEPILKVQFSGDLLTAERCRSLLHARTDSDSSTDRHDSVISHAEDFHCSMNFVDAIFLNYFRPSSALTDCGTLSNLKLHLKRKNITRDAKHNHQASIDFLDDVADGFLLAETLNYFKVESLSDIKLPEYRSEEDRVRHFWTVVAQIVDGFVFSSLENRIAAFLPDLKSRVCFHSGRQQFDHDSYTTNDVSPAVTDSVLEYV